MRYKEGERKKREKREREGGSRGDQDGAGSNDLPLGRGLDILMKKSLSATSEFADDLPRKHVCRTIDV